MEDYQNKLNESNFTENVDDSTTYTGFGYAMIPITAIIIAGNGIVLLANCLVKSLHKPVGNLLIVNLAVVDLLSGIAIALPLAIILLPCEPMTVKEACFMNTFSSYLLITIAHLTLSLISCDRWVAVAKSLWYPSLVTRRKVKLLIVLTWIHGLVISISAFVGSSFSLDGLGTICKLKWTDPNFRSKWFFSIIGVMSFGIPLIAMIVFNILIVLVLKKLRSVDFCIQPGLNNVVGYRQGQGSEQFSTCSVATRRSLRTMYVVFGVYIFTFTPFALTKFVAFVWDVNFIPTWVDLMVTLLKLCSSACNPFIYAILRKDYRNAFVKLYRICTSAVR